jgi:hypothetical protein
MYLCKECCHEEDKKLFESSGIKHLMMPCDLCQKEKVVVRCRFEPDGFNLQWRWIELKGDKWYYC